MDESKLRETIATLAKQEKKQALAEVITEWLNPGHLTLELANLMLDAKSLNAGDSLLFKTRKGLKVRTLVPGQIPLRDEITVSERIAYVLDMADIAVNANLWDLESGELGTVAEIKSEMAAKFRDFYVNKLFTALSDSWNAVDTADNYADCSGSLSFTALKAMIDTINQTTAGAKVIVGTRAALTPITTFAGFWTNGSTTSPVDSVLEEIMRTGWLGTFYGVRVLALDQIYDNPISYTAMLPTDKVLVIGQNVGSFITYGPMNTKEYIDQRPTPPEWIYELYQQFGMIIHNMSGIGVLAVS